MATKHDQKTWVLEALHADGEAGVIEVAKHTWQHYAEELRNSGGLCFYAWQYDMRWTATQIRKEGLLQPAKRGSRDPRRLAK